MKRASVYAGIALAVILGVLAFGAGCAELGETACDAMSGQDRDHCLQKVADTTNNAKLCEKIEGAGPATKCLAFVAKNTGNLLACSKMEDEQWYRARDAYHQEDCMMYVAINAKSPVVCDFIAADFHSQATDLNPRLDVTRENCLKSIQCGKSGQPACRMLLKFGSGSETHPILAPEGQADAYSCGEVRYPQPVTCP